MASTLTALWGKLIKTKKNAEASGQTNKTRGCGRRLPYLRASSPFLGKPPELAFTLTKKRNSFYFPIFFLFPCPVCPRYEEGPFLRPFIFYIVSHFHAHMARFSFILFFCISFIFQEREVPRSRGDFVSFCCRSFFVCVFWSPKFPSLGVRPLPAVRGSALRRSPPLASTGAQR